MFESKTIDGYKIDYCPDEKFVQLKSILNQLDFGELGRMAESVEEDMRQSNLKFGKPKIIFDEEAIIWNDVEKPKILFEKTEFPTFRVNHDAKYGKVVLEFSEPCHSLSAMRNAIVWVEEQMKNGGYKFNDPEVDMDDREIVWQIEKEN